MGSISHSDPGNNFFQSFWPRFQKGFNELFKLDAHIVKTRLLLSLITVFVIWTVFALYLRPFLNSIFLPDNRTLNMLGELILASYFAPDVIRHLAVTAFAFLIAYHYVNLYLNEVFEIQYDKTSKFFILRNFIGIPNADTVIIENVKNPFEKKNETFRKIGGPAKVMIGLENAAVFERFDGTVEIIGPTTNLPGSYFQLSSFERLREVIDLRNQTIQFDIHARTRDGIQISAKNVRLIFSVLRGSSKITLTRPYPFSSQAVYWLVYQQPNESWTEKVIELVKQQFSSFLRDHTVAEILASVGEPELQRQMNLEIVDQNRKWRQKRQSIFFKHPHHFFLPQKQERKTLKALRSHPNKPHFPLSFDPRMIRLPTAQPAIQRKQVSIVFYEEFGNSFSKQTNQHGIKLDWIGVGAWDSPVKKVFLQHKEAWRLSAENLLKSSRTILDDIRNKSLTREMSLIYHNIFGFYQANKNAQSGNQSEKVILNKMMDFLKLSREIYNNKSLEKRNQLEKTVSMLEDLIKKE